jgi:hypothetical protein
MWRSGPEGRYIQAPVSRIIQERPEFEEWRCEPLVNYPDLFLRFARLADEDRLDDHADPANRA